MAYRITPGSPEPLGVTPVDKGVNVAVFSAHASAIEFCLFDDTGKRERERLRLPGRSGDVFHAHIADVPLGARYGLRVHGPYAPRAGHRFNPAKLLVDPYALQLDRPFALHASMFGFGRGDPDSDNQIDTADSAAVVPKAIVVDRNALRATPTSVRVPWSDTVIYELHVRGYTKQHPAIPKTMRGTFAALAQPAAIAHLAELGITTVEIMPAAAWIDERHLPPLGLHNYWGYNPIAMMAPDPRLAPGGWAEIRQATDALHAAGIEVLLDVVFNHSGESDELGPTLSFRGLDNASYYRLVPDAPQRYINDTGCGNCLALDRAPLVRLALDSMRTWIQLGGIDGFRFDLATTLGRRETGFDAGAPLLAAIDQDPLLREAKLIAEPWDPGPGGYQAGNFPDGYGEWNDRFRDDVRRYWRGDAGLRGALATRLAGSADLFAAKGRPSHSVNFISAHDGFTLADLVAYERKHNDANGEQNRDGTDANYSWNHGVEGASSDARIIAARRRDQRNLLATLLLARGTPMLAMGAELGLTHAGNNNAYAQDNAGSWIDWLHADHDLIDFTRRLIAQRHAHRALRDDRFLAGAVIDGRGIADIEWRGAEGALIDAADWEKSNSDTLVAAFYASTDEAVSDRVAIAIHRGRNDIRVALPSARAGFVWRRCLDTAKAAIAVMTAESGSANISARSVVTFVETQDDRKSRNSHTDNEILNRLAQTAGIAADWWDVAGTQHAVSPETKRTLLAAMSLRAETEAQARESLERIMQTRQHRLLPMTRVVRADASASVDLRVTVPAAQSPPRGGATVRNDAGEVIAQIATADLATQILSDPLGLRLRVSALSLPQLEMGRYQVSFDALPDTVCQLTIAPRHCFRPPLLDADQRGGVRSFGLSVQAYSLRRANANDSGIGDFSAIGEFAQHAARAGAATIGINPLHMLFPADRERVSPYHPSDRRFIDPIYLDPGALYDLPGFTEAGLQWQQNRFRMHLATRDDIEYSAVWALKNTALQALFTSMQRAMRDQADSSIVREFLDFVRARGESLRLFATFQVIAEMHANSAWTTWPNALRSAHRIEVEAFAAQHAGRVRYHEFLQWLCERQLAATAAHARDNGLTLGLYRDLAVGAAPDGAETWANAAQLARDVSIGAPPDPLAPAGQVWNLPPPNPLAWQEHDYASFRQALAANMRHAGILRIDHVLGLARLFWVPAGGKAIDGAYVAYPTEDLLGHLALESQRQQCAVIGEDLGTVPDGLREKLADNGMLRYQVMLLERDGTAFKSPAGYSANAAACASTHDLPPLAGWWQAADIRERESLGLTAGAEITQLLSVRHEEKRLLVEAINAAGVSLHIDLDAPLAANAMAALHAWLARAPSTLLLAQAEDLAFETVAQNLPGTDRERPNWRRRLAATSEELLTSESVQRVLQALRR
ncbi:MAG TPA: glycogen debranching protein GlgX [Rudaea sp.]|jgi:glycogen operon protein|uniref:glycogen debranching protein GlgX n=1 Tax=Rudaea sp. TaxID=2136325 RepID=UPI002F947216